MLHNLSMLIAGMLILSVILIALYILIKLEITYADKIMERFEGKIPLIVIKIIATIVIIAWFIGMSYGIGVLGRQLHWLWL